MQITKVRSELKYENRWLIQFIEILRNDLSHLYRRFIILSILIYLIVKVGSI